jgi:hypothetical protein
MVARNENRSRVVGAILGGIVAVMGAVIGPTLGSRLFFIGPRVGRCSVSLFHETSQK